VDIAFLRSPQCRHPEIIDPGRPGHPAQADFPPDRLLQPASHDYRRIQRPCRSLRSAAENSYDLIITDIGIPGMSGIDFIKNLTAIGCRASLLIISGYDSRILHAIVRMARGQGMPSVHFLCKPYSIDQFLHQLNAVLPIWSSRLAVPR
jgi:DNA-binding response OmpR family regulator